jgi:hypothetical protein
MAHPPPSVTGLGFRNSIRNVPGLGWIARAGNSLVNSFSSRPNAGQAAPSANAVARSELANTFISPDDSPLTYVDALQLIVSYTNLSSSGAARDRNIRGFISSGTIPCGSSDRLDCTLTKPYNIAMMERLYELMGPAGIDELARMHNSRVVAAMEQKIRAFQNASPMPPTRSMYGGRRRSTRRNRQSRRQRQRQNRRQSRRN